MNELETSMREAGYVRCPNESGRWYHEYSEVKRPAFPMEIRVTDKIWIVTRPYGGGEDIIPLLAFSKVEHLEEYIERNGVVVQAGANVWH